MDEHSRPRTGTATLAEALAALDDLEPGITWRDVERHVLADQASAGPVAGSGTGPDHAMDGAYLDAAPAEPTRHRTRFWLAVAASVVVGVLAAGLIAGSRDDQDTDVGVDVGGEPHVDPAPTSTAPEEGRAAGTVPAEVSDQGSGWRRFGPAPIATVPGLNGIGRELSASVWTGDELVMWGGRIDGEESYADGAALDPAASTWRTLAPSPLSARSGHIATWTGSEVIIWGGVFEQSTDLDDGAAYDPASDSWRAIATSPLEGGAGYDAVWTGSELIVLGGRSGYATGGQNPSVRHNEAAAYDPASNTWRRLPPLPLDLSFVEAHWTGNEVYAVGGQSFTNGTFSNLRGEVLVASLDPESGRWEELPPSGISAQSATAVWSDGALYLVTYQPDADGTRVWLPDRGVWEDRAAMPIPPCEGRPMAVAHPSGFLAGLCGGTAVYESGTGTWRSIAPPTTDAINLLSPFDLHWTGTELLAPTGLGEVWSHRP